MIDSLCFAPCLSALMKSQFLYFLITVNISVCGFLLCKNKRKNSKFYTIRLLLKKIIHRSVNRKPEYISTGYLQVISVRSSYGLYEMYLPNVGEEKGRPRTVMGRKSGAGTVPALLICMLIWMPGYSNGYENVLQSKG